MFRGGEISNYDEMNSTFGLGVAHPNSISERRESIAAAPSPVPELNNPAQHLVFRTDIFSNGADTLPLPPRPPVSAWHVPNPYEYICRNSYQFALHSGLTQPEHPEAIRILQTGLAGNRHLGLPPPPVGLPPPPVSNVFSFCPALARPVSPIPDSPPITRPPVIVETIHGSPSPEIPCLVPEIVFFAINVGLGLVTIHNLFFKLLAS